MRRSVKDWIIVGVLLLDEVAALGLVYLALWAFKITMPLWFAIVIALLLGTFVSVSYTHLTLPTILLV